MKIKLFLLLLIACCPLAPVHAMEADSVRVFSEEHPLVYEDAWDLWPYAFLNESGEPVGYNIDLLKMICKELSIPCIIKLKPTGDALNDLKERKADLMFGMDAHFHNDYASYGNSVIQIFTHSVLHHKDEPVRVKQLEDLASQQVIVHEGSFSHHLMISRGWGKNAIPYDDMQDAVRKAHVTPDCQIVWNTLSLKYLIRKLHCDNLELTPVNIQHGEYKFMSNNPYLLHMLDSVYSVLDSEERLQPLQNKWFYPEREDSGVPAWIWKAIVLLVLLSLAAIGYYLIYRYREKKMTSAVRSSNNRLNLILKTSRVRIWQYNVADNTITHYDEEGRQDTMSFSRTSFYNNPTPEGFEKTKNAIAELIAQKKGKNTFTVQAYSTEEGELRNYVVELSVLRRDKNGRPTHIIGTSSDITNEQLRQQQMRDTMLLYQAIFNSAMVDNVAYDQNGVIVNMSERSYAILGIDKQEILDRHITVQDVLGLPDLQIEDMDYTYLTQIYKNEPDDQRPLNKYLRLPELYYELQLVPVRDDDGKLMAIYGTGRNVTEVAKSFSQMQQNTMQLQHVNNEMQKYIQNIDFVLQNGGVRLANYSPDTHTLVIYSEIDHAQNTLTQTRVMALTDDKSRKVVRRLITNMDNRTRSTQSATVKTALRIKGRQLCIYLSFIPTLDDQGQVTGYFGMCRDISEIMATEEQLAQETEKAQEVEAVKNAFLRNMSYEIRTPLNSVVGFAELFQMEHSADDEAVFIGEIKENATRLLNLVNDILFLSRLDARMIEIKPEPIDFAAVFDSCCQSTYTKCQQPDVEYIVINPYHKLVVDIDYQNFGIMLDRIIVNAVQHTRKGHVTMRYDYTGEDLVVTIGDTGEGIPEERLQSIYERFASGSKGTGLGLSICHEIALQMNGRITIKSDVGVGTIVWVAIPCKCLELERKL